MKLESENEIGSFKGRGMDWFMQQWSGSNHVVTASAGNFGQAVAYCGTRRGIASTVFSATNASPVKVEAMRRFGATVHLHGDDFDAAKEAAMSFAADRGLAFIEDGKETEISEGAGTIALELMASEYDIDAIFIPVGNGALISGIGAYVKSRSPTTRVIGVCAEAAPSMYLSWKQGKAVETASAKTIADGIACRVPVPESLIPVAEVVDDMILVSESTIRSAMQALKEHENLMVEPAGAVSLAGAVLQGSNFHGATVATIVTGNNVERRQFEAYLDA